MKLTKEQKHKAAYNYLKLIAARKIELDDVVFDIRDFLEEIAKEDPYLSEGIANSEILAKGYRGTCEAVAEFYKKGGEK